MAGSVLVDRPEAGDEAATFRPGPVWVTAITGVVLVVVLTLPVGPQETTSSSLPVPQVVTPGERWTPLMVSGARLNDVADLGEGRFVAVGYGPQVWFSDSASAWESALEDASHVGDLVAVTAYRGGAVAVGGGTGGDPWIWLTEDGADWRRVEIDLLAAAPLSGVAVGDDQIVAWGARSFGGSFLVHSLDGEEWREFTGPGSMTIQTVSRVEGDWYAGGSLSNRPALYRTDDFERWWQIYTADLEPGREIVDVETGDGLVITLADRRSKALSRWRPDPEVSGRWEKVDDLPGVPAGVSRQESFAVGSGRLWRERSSGWLDLGLEGHVTAAAGVVAVGHDPAGAGVLWVRDAEVEPTLEAKSAPSGGWQQIQDLEGKGLRGLWRVANRWLVATDEEWWTIDGDGVDQFHPPWPGVPWTIQPAGAEWVALPSMHWTSDGSTWEQRPRPWEATGAHAQVVAVSGNPDRLVAVGYDDAFEWSAAESTDLGHSWEAIQVEDPGGTIWGVVAVPDGFAANTSPGPGAHYVVTSADGRTWDRTAAGQVQGPWFQVPSAITDQGTLMILDTGEEVELPEASLYGVARDGDLLAYVSGGALWVRDGGWKDYPLDPAHGVTGGVARPVPIDGRLMIVVASGTGVEVLEWAD